jgi:hypothetical protein
VNLSEVNGKELCQGGWMISLTTKEEKRLEVIQRLFQGEVTVIQAALVLEITRHQTERKGFKALFL